MTSVRPNHFTFCVSLLSLVFASALLTSTAMSTTIQERPALKRYFDEAGTDGTIVVHDRKAKTSIVYNPDRARRGFVPASTFKIVNSLIALETGVVQDPDREVFTYSGTPFLVGEKPFLPKQCEANISLRTAFQFSCIPVYQEIARRVGMDHYAKVLSQIGYGDVAALKSERIDWFWLEGAYTVSAEQQTAFLNRLYQGDLPFSPSAIEKVKDIMVSEKGPDYVIRSKTGYLFSSQPALGWCVGWIERGDNVHVFALNLDLTKPAEQAKARIGITKAVLKDLGAF